MSLIKNNYCLDLFIPNLLGLLEDKGLIAFFLKYLYLDMTSFWNTADKEFKCFKIKCGNSNGKCVIDAQATFVYM